MYIRMSYRQRYCWLLLTFIFTVAFIIIAQKMVKDIQFKPGRMILAKQKVKRYVFNKFRVPVINCFELFRNKQRQARDESKAAEEIRAVSEDAAKALQSLNVDTDWVLRSAKRTDKAREKYCDLFRRKRGYVSESLTWEEKEFPIAYSIHIRSDVQMFERLLRAIYRPQNCYCVLIDLSSERRMHQVIHTIVNCFTNVFIPEKLTDIMGIDGRISVLQADLLCMTELLKRFKKWKYYINLTSQEFPLKTNLEIVRIFQAFHGLNHLHTAMQKTFYFRSESAPPIPVNVTLVKDEMHLLASREFVSYAINNDTAIKFRNWVTASRFPYEMFLATLGSKPDLSSPSAPEFFTGHYAYLSRHKCWRWDDESLPDCALCAGNYVNSICKIGTGDLPKLVARRELFVNKCNADFEPAAYACLEELHYNRTRKELMGRVEFNATEYYSQLSLIN